MRLIKKEILKEQYERYDLSIDGAYNNFVAEGVVVHNSNFGFMIPRNGIDVHVFKRTGVISKGSNENFYGHMQVFADNVLKLRSMLEQIKQEFDTGASWANGLDLVSIDQVTVYGEIFGGGYPHIDVPREQATRVQKGIRYTPKNMFYAFDIAINGRLINDDDCQRLLRSAGIFNAEPLFRGSLQECIAYSNEFQTTIPARLGLPEIANNICEGVVIRPVFPKYFGCGSRVILKNKNEKWSEKAHVPKERKEVKFSEAGEKVYTLLAELITENRLRNVLSKIGTVTQKDFGRILAEYNKDVIAEFSKDNAEAFDALDKEESKMIGKVVNKASAELIRENFQNIIDGGF